MKRWMKWLLITLILLIFSGAGTFTYFYFNTDSHSDQTNSLPLSDKIQEAFQEEPDLDEPKKIRIVGLGDSLTKGVGDHAKEGYIGYVSDKYFEKDQDATVTLKNYAITGSETKDLLKRLEQETVRNGVQKADYIFLTIGGNDLFGVVKNHFMNLDQQFFTLQKKIYLENLTTILATIRNLNPDAPIYFTGLFNPFSKAFGDIPEMNEIVDDWNQGSRSTVSDTTDATFVPVADLFLESEENLLYEDAFHPNDDGYHLMGDRIVSYLKENNVANR
ncbi:SGNH/GDSL hydrolase family protein [Bacillus sp. es.036]|uniref:SGNH/GDSL hydrolase family protein n=1 Tax=Bacillus sp. es.036 TaxID=1761764 RepID=UPI000C00496E|nr:SGNH/GDSL hydrolase family protein [Bacillus sp. es.036]PFG13128.1 lysophospholipase L1-like esterase [Bacillus sp. es.036]